MDDDFIAAYQASYGVTQKIQEPAAGTNVATATATGDTGGAPVSSFTLQVGWVCTYVAY